MRKYIVFLRPHKRLSQWDQAHNKLHPHSVRITASNKAEAKTKARKRLYTVTEVIEE